VIAAAVVWIMLAIPPDTPEMLGYFLGTFDSEPRCLAYALFVSAKQIMPMPGWKLVCRISPVVTKEES